MTVRELYEKHKNDSAWDAWISYVWEFICPCCKKIAEKEDEEYSSWVSDLEDFLKDYDCFAWEDEVFECRNEKGEIFYKYINNQCHVDNFGDVCQNCEEEE